MFYHRYAFLSLAVLAMMPLSVSAACRADFPGYLSQLQSGTNQQIEDAISGTKSLYIDTICGSKDVKVFTSTQTDTFQIFDNDRGGWRCETNLNMFIWRGAQATDPKALIYEFPAGGGDVVVTGCHTTQF